LTIVEIHLYFPSVFFFLSCCQSSFNHTWWLMFWDAFLSSLSSNSLPECPHSLADFQFIPQSQVPFIAGLCTAPLGSSPNVVNYQV
jgi:hypothetical protein